MHPRVAVSGLCFPALSAVEAIAETGDLGVTKTSMTSAKLREAGSAANVDSYARLAKDLVSYAAEKNLSIAVEPTNWLYADLTFIHSFRDAVEFCSRAGLKACLDLFTFGPNPASARPSKSTSA